MIMRRLLIAGLIVSLPATVFAQRVDRLVDLNGQQSGQALNNEELTVAVRILREQIKQLTDEQQRGGLGGGSLSNKMEDPQFAREFGDAVHTTIRRTGTVHITNKMATDQYIMINGTQHLVFAGAKVKITVPTGTVSTRLPGQETVNWTITAPNYAQGIDISPRQTVFRQTNPPASNSISAPIYVSPPIGIGSWPMVIYY